jgi:hypothetical protein
MQKIWIEKKFIIIFSLFVIILTTIPYWLGFSLQNELFKFSGFIIGVGDGNSYLAKMMIGASGDWLFTTPYTAYPQIPFFAFFPYILLGKLTSPPEQTLQFISLFHLFRWMGIFFLINETYQFILMFVSDEKIARLSTFLLVFGGGFGWLGIIFPQIINHRLPLEFYSPETFGYLSFFSLPHLLFARGFLYRAFRTFLYLKNSNNNSKLFYIKSGFSLFLSGIFQPLNIFIGWFVIGSYYLYQLLVKKLVWMSLKEFFYWIIPSIPLFFYNFFSFLFDPYLSAWQDQNRITSPPIIDYLLAYGPGLLFLIWAVKSREINKIKNLIFISIWILLIPILVYFPINIQRRLSEGVWLCFCIFISIVVMGKKGVLTRVIYTTFFLLSTLLFSTGSLQAVMKLNSPIYTSASIINVANSLSQDIEKGEVILAPFNESNVLPAYLPIKVISGHGPESKNLSVISKKLDAFYQGNLGIIETHELIRSFNIKYIIVPQEMDREYILLQLDKLKFQYHYKNSDYEVIKIDD